LDGLCGENPTAGWRAPDVADRRLHVLLRTFPRAGSGVALVGRHGWCSAATRLWRCCSCSWVDQRGPRGRPGRHDHPPSERTRLPSPIARMSTPG